MTTAINPGSRVGEVAVLVPRATRVFARHRIDFCCRGAVTLEEACSAQGVAVEAVIDEIAAESVDKATEHAWHEAPLGELIDHILETYHRPLDEELPRIEGMARKVLEVHRDRDGDRLERVLAAFLALQHELVPHMQKEEQILFPMIRAGSGAMAQGPIHVMWHEHAEAGVLLERLRSLTDDFVPPDGACTTWRALWEALADLERDTHQHIHLENNILFPRALGG